MRVLTILFLGLSIFARSQNVIVEEKFEKDNVPLGYYFLVQKNELVIQKGKHVGISTNREIHELISFDINGNQKILLKNAAVMNPYFSFNENTFRVVDYAKMSFTGSTYKIIKDGKASKQFNVDPHYNYLVDDYQFNIENQKGKTLSAINFEKDDLYLKIMNFDSYAVKKIKIDKPDISRLIGEDNVKYGKDLNFKVIPKKESFELITKSIKSDYKSAIIYRTIYNYEGKKIKELNYKVSISENYLMYCNNGGGEIGSNTNGYPVFEDDLNINNFIVDEKTNEVYVYGLIGKKDRRSNFISNEPLGYYIFKFSEDGDKIWESINMISDKKDFNDDQTISLTLARLTIKDNQLLFFIGPHIIANKDYMHYSLMDMSNGKLISSVKLNYKLKSLNTLMTGTRDFILSFLTNKEELKNKTLDFEGLMMYNEDNRFKNYINSVNSKNEIDFISTVTREGTWLIESDNKSYYKVIYFE